MRLGSIGWSRVGLDGAGLDASFEKLQNQFIISSHSYSFQIRLPVIGFQTLDWILFLLYRFNVSVDLTSKNSFYKL